MELREIIFLVKEEPVCGHTAQDIKENNTCEV
jgi:hypothetical protein